VTNKGMWAINKKYAGIIFVSVCNTFWLKITFREDYIQNM
jgi:hypothetical protein